MKQRVDEGIIDRHAESPAKANVNRGERRVKGKRGGLGVSLPRVPNLREVRQYRDYLGFFFQSEFNRSRISFSFPVSAGE